MEPEKPKPELSAQERLGKDAQKEAVILRNVLWFPLWTLLALIPTIALLLVEMPPVWRAIIGILCALFWLLTLRGMFRFTGLLDAGKVRSRSTRFMPEKRRTRPGKESNEVYGVALSVGRQIPMAPPT
jgi:hypothetical protein